MTLVLVDAVKVSSKRGYPFVLLIVTKKEQSERKKEEKGERGTHGTLRFSVILRFINLVYAADTKGYPADLNFSELALKKRGSGP